MELSTLWFQERPGPAVLLEQPGSPVQTVIIDYVVDRKWFAEALAERGWGSPAPNIDWGWNGNYSPFGTGDQQQQLERADALVPETQTKFGIDRAGLLFCSQCGDEYCGVFSARVVERDAIVSWIEFKSSWFEFFPEGDGWQGDGVWNHDAPVAEVQFHFDARQYREAIAHLKRLIGTMRPWPGRS